MLCPFARPITNCWYATIPVSNPFGPEQEAAGGGVVLLPKENEPLKFAVSKLSSRFSRSLAPNFTKCFPKAMEV